MRFLLIVPVVLFGSGLLRAPALAAAPAVTQDVAAPAPAKRDHASILNDLFASLKKAKTEQAALSIANGIRGEWANSGSATVNLLMQWSDAALDKKDYTAALDFLDQAIVLKPQFAEGWNHRATLHFVMNNYTKSMADIEKTLALEPRHFGALTGLGLILLSYDRKEQALKAYSKALEVYPLMRDVQKQVGDIEEQIAGSRT